MPGAARKRGLAEVLEHTFLHIQGIGPKTERGIWRKGIKCWQDFLNFRGTVFSSERDGFVRRELEESIAHKQDAAYFAGRLPSPEAWRLFGQFGQNAVYLDIETSGSYQGQGEITVIGIYDGSTVRSFINGKNLDEFEEAVPGYDLLVTFNGTCFDVPVIKRFFRQVKLPPVHIDLRFLLKRIGLKGGLKAIERQAGIRRESEVEGLDGYDAVMLWDAYRWGDEASLERLVKYNAADIVSLKTLLDRAYERLRNDAMACLE